MVLNNAMRTAAREVHRVLTDESINLAAFHELVVQTAWKYDLDHAHLFEAFRALYGDNYKITLGDNNGPQ